YIHHIGFCMSKVRISPTTERDIMEKMEEIEEKIGGNKEIFAKIEEVAFSVRNILFVIWIFLSAIFAIASIFSSLIEEQIFSFIFLGMAVVVLIGTVITFIVIKK
ncbi:MAG: hypothetical protein JXA91_05715, partial [Candidatus Thermoplasmatota archaeon]|nr:hypothetical protein [Candidatus Thermoplasmatota archaeon]